MTGYGSSIAETEFGRLTVDIRGVNNRFLDANVRMGSTFLHLDQKIRAIIRDTIKRGKVDVIVRFEPADDMIPPIRINEKLYRTIKVKLREIDSNATLSAGEMLQMPGVLLSEFTDDHPEELDKELRKLVDNALEKFNASRAEEGETLLKDFFAHQKVMAEKLKEIISRKDEVVTKYRDKLHTRIEELMQQHKGSIDQGRLEAEVAIFADKADITEEVNRLSGHLDSLKQKLDSKKFESGKALEFLCQEILREVNTIGSKCRDLDVARFVIELKQELESLRENLANVE